MAVYLPSGLWQVTAEVYLPGSGRREFQRRYATERHAAEQVRAVGRWPFPHALLGVHYTDTDWRDIACEMRAAYRQLEREEQHDE